MAKVSKTATPKQSNAPVSWLLRTNLVAGFLFLLSFALYLNTLGHDYALDDAIVITDNAFTTQGVRGIPGILTNDTFYGFFQDASKANLVAGGRYRPFSLIWFALEYQLWGPNPFWGHLINALLYAFSVWLIYRLLLLLFSRSSDRNYAPFVALAASLLFAVHPLHTEVVANIKGRDEILALLGSVAALYFSFSAYRQKKYSFATALWVGVVFFMALLSKENAITFMAVVPLAFYFFGGADTGKLVRYALPFWGAGVLFVALRSAILGVSLLEVPMEMMNNPFVKVQGDVLVPFTFAEKSATIVYTLGKYLQLLFVPHPLTHDYYPRHIGIMSWGDPLVWISLLAGAAILLFAVWSLRSRAPWGFALWYYLITLSVVSNIVFPIGTNMSERLIYMPSLAWGILMATLIYPIAAKRTIPSLAAIGGVALIFAILTLVRNPAWKDNYALFTTDIRTAPNSAKLRNAVGGEIIAVTQSSELPEVQKNERYREAIGHLQRAIDIYPGFKNAWLLLGNAHSYLKQYDAALGYYDRALRLDAGYRDALNNKGITLINAGRALEAIDFFQQIKQQFPAYPNIDNNIAVAHREAGKYFGEKMGDLSNALYYLKTAYQLLPNDYETLRLLGVAYGIRGDSAEAVNWFTKAYELDPDNAGAIYNLGTAWYNAGETERGQALIDRARALDPSL
ncbi:MAG: tetratricopeptide repeat protein [Saprospiraceae bacterium]|nr:tetratricopeptide repeat protein [Saprospiraceae bacterium]